VDDLPPVTVITHVRRGDKGCLVVSGTTADNGTVKRVLVNGQEARPLAPNFAQWEAVLRLGRQTPDRVVARAQDLAGNVEPRPHVIVLGGYP
jgi:hypothetical protein